MIILFGHTGTLGRTLHHHLVTSGRECTGISTRQCNLLDADSLRSRLASIRPPYTVINCAVINRHRCTNEEGLQQNLIMADTIASAIPQGACRLFLQMSSVDVYGESPVLPITEISLTTPSTFYGRAKFGAEASLAHLREQGVPLAILRLPGVYGPADRGQSLIGNVLRRTLTERQISISSDGELLRDYLFMDDLHRIVDELLAEPRDVLLNVATGHSRSLRDIISLIHDALQRPCSITFQGGVNGGASHLVFDTRRLRAHFPDLHFTDLAEGIARYAYALKTMPG